MPIYGLGPSKSYRHLFWFYITNQMVPYFSDFYASGGVFFSPFFPPLFCSKKQNNNHLYFEEWERFLRHFWTKGIGREASGLLLVLAHGASQSMTGARKVQFLCSGISKNSLRILSHKLWIWFNRNYLLISLFCQCCDRSRTFYFSCSEILPPGAQLCHFQKFVAKFSMILKSFSF